MASDNSYKSLLKGISAFGGVQVFQIILNWARAKCVAVLLGTGGMGISALFTSSSNTIQKFSSLGLNLAIVKEIADNSEDETMNPRVIGLAIKLLAITSAIGALICMIFARPLSILTFNNDCYVVQFRWLGLAVAFGIMSAGMMCILQGLHQVKYLSKASIVGGFTGLLVGVPLYYIYGTEGIVPAMIALSIATCLFYYISILKVVKPSYKYSIKQNIPTLKRLVGMGVILMLSDIIGTIIIYIINLVVSTLGSVEEVGLYQAATSATAQYSGMVFAAMAMDYFPRLTKAAADNRQMHEIVNRQTEIVSLIITPAASLLILTAPIIIQILFTSQFSPILPLMRWMGLGIMFRALAFPMAYITFAKGNKKVFFLLEGVVCNVLTLTLSCLGYYLYGLIGLGYALIADNALCIAIYYVVNRKLYGYRFSKESITCMIGAIIVTSICFLGSLISNAMLSYLIMATVCILSVGWSVISLRKKLKKQ